MLGLTRNHGKKFPKYSPLKFHHPNEKEAKQASCDEKRKIKRLFAHLIFRKGVNSFLEWNKVIYLEICLFKLTSMQMTENRNK